MSQKDPHMQPPCTASWPRWRGAPGALHMGQECRRVRLLPELLLLYCGLEFGSWAGMQSGGHGAQRTAACAPPRHPPGSPAGPSWQCSWCGGTPVQHCRKGMAAAGCAGVCSSRGGACCGSCSWARACEAAAATAGLCSHRRCCPFAASSCCSGQPLPSGPGCG